MLEPSNRLRYRLNPNCPYCPSLSKEKMREESSRDTPCALSRPWQFSEKPRSPWGSWDRQELVRGTAVTLLSEAGWPFSRAIVGTINPS